MEERFYVQCYFKSQAHATMRVSVMRPHQYVSRIAGKGKNTGGIEMRLDAF